MKTMLMVSLILLTASAAGVDKDAKAQGMRKAELKSGPSSDWNEIQAQRTQAIAEYLAQKPMAYRWFADFPFSGSDGIPYIILKLLPKIAPELWGSEENPFDVVGLFVDERLKDYPIARGIGWAGMARDDPNAAADYASFTCGSCHIQRVRLDDGRLQYLDGGINTEFNLVQYRVRVIKTIQKMIGNATVPAEKVERAKEAILSALDQVHSEDKNYFYGNYRLGDRAFDAAYEANQIALFKQNAPTLVQGFLGRADLEFKAFGALVNKNYKGFEAPMLQGFGGMADATGVSTSFGYIVRKELRKDPNANPETDLPPTPGITDFMAVWEQGKRKVSWSADHTRLVRGGGQWNGNIPVPMFRNLAAQLTLGLKDTDVRIAVFSQDLLEGLPAPAYPFDVDLALAKKGEPLYREHCAACHRPHNAKVYGNTGTDMGRAFVVSEPIAASGRKKFTEVCSPTTRAQMPGDLGTITPCARFGYVSLEGKAQFAMKDPIEQDGYNALPLGGIWAQAPYLHNGSVPTLYHLLVPSERPKVFIKSRLDYDKKRVGFSWEPDTPAPSGREEGYRFDTTAFCAFSNLGHDKDIREAGKRYKLDWSDDKAGAMALIEYMKTL